jgi:cysteine synthase
MKINKKVWEKSVKRCKEKGIVLPTFAEQRDPSKVPQKVKDALKGVKMTDVNPLNLYRITWKNDITTGGFGGVNYLEVPSSLTGIKTRVVGLVGRYFPTGAHKVGAAYGCLVPRLVTGEFDPTRQKAVWPSTGNYCRGGAYDSALLACHSIAILPEEMSKERFDWLKKIGSEIIATPGCESNVKEIFDKCNELNRTRGDDIVVFNQFEEFGNGMWHYNVTAEAILEVFNTLSYGGRGKGEGANLAAFVSATGSAGTICAGDKLKEVHKDCKITAAEALQCPTLLNNGFGAHRIEGIGDKHVPWVHNVRNTDIISAIDDEACIRLMRMFNEPAGKAFLKAQGVEQGVIDRLNSLGISGICNLLSSVRTARALNLGTNDVVFTIFTDSMELYGSRLAEEKAKYGEYTARNAEADWKKYIVDGSTGEHLVLNERERKRIHNLKYFTWIEQQGKEIGELNAQWNDPAYWTGRWRMAGEYERLIEEFNNA